MPGYQNRMGILLVHAGCCIVYKIQEIWLYLAWVFGEWCLYCCAVSKFCLTKIRLTLTVLPAKLERKKTRTNWTVSACCTVITATRTYQVIVVEWFDVM